MALSISRAASLRSLLAGASLLTAGPALAQSQLAQTQPVVDEVVVTGSRLSEARTAIGTDQPTATISITRQALLSAPAGISGLKMLESLPGFNVQANDPLGLYEFGNSVSIRAFNIQQIGFLLDDIPMGRSDQFGGSPIYRYVENENLDRVTASPGAGDVSRPSYTSLGPIVDYVTRQPSQNFGAHASYSQGSYDLRRGFLRLDTGEHRGLSAFASASLIRGDVWRGPGDFRRDHYEGKVRYQAENIDLTFKTVHNKYADFDSPAITLGQFAGTVGDVFGRSGRDFGYIDYVPTPGAPGSPATAQSLPQTAAGVPFSNPLYGNYYRFAINNRQDHLYALTLRAPLGETQLSATTYYEDKSGYGVSPEAYATSLAAYNNQRLVVPGLTAPRGLQYGLSKIDGDREGVTANLSRTIGVHHLQAGVWFERDRYHRLRQRDNMTNGDPAGSPLLNEPVHLQANYTSMRTIVELFAKDTLQLLDDRLKVELGFRSLGLDYDIGGARNAQDFIAGRRPDIRANWTDNFLPQVGLVYNFDSRDQVFASYSEAMSLPRGADDIFSAASPAAPGPKAERAKNYEIGVRTNRATFNASLTAYRTEFQNRLQPFAAIVPGSTQVETFYQNVGRVEAYGAEFSGQWKPGLLDGRLYFNANLGYNVSTFRDDFATFAISGKTVPDFPEWTAQAGATFEATPWAILNVSARHISSRFGNYLNTESVDGYTIWNAYLDLGGTEAGPLGRLHARLNVDNIFDKTYLGTINPVTAGAATYRPGPPRTVQVTLSADF
ncbi:TonB-dependent receptor [Phenylobacterium sp. LjRoot225]|uniref:TonB-dependent receptor n=1 Tax=Phenylobacterium sp. LjRoot225 TaxID=3342285 RepID=UPI003ED02D50